MPELDDAKIAENALARYNAAEPERRQMQSFYSAISNYVRPDIQSAGATGVPTSAKSTYKFDRLYDTTLVEANQDHAAGVKAWMSPSQSPWLELHPPDWLKGDDEAESWYAAVTPMVQTAMLDCGFHSKEFEVLLDGGGFGLRSMMVVEGQTKPLHFERWEPGTFSVVENSEGVIDSCFQRKEMTARQAAGMWGEERLPLDVRAKLAKDMAAKHDGEKELYIFCLYPRSDAERDKWKLTADHMPVAALWIHERTKTIVWKSGYEEMPSINSRYMTWGGTAYGMPPALYALANARQLNIMQRDLDFIVEVEANPRMLLPSSLEGVVNTMPGAATFYDDVNQKPEAWLQNGQGYTIGQDRVAMRQKSIRGIYHLDAFRTFQDITKRMTTEEVLSVRAEAIDQFSPTFTKMVEEHYGPIIQRTFNILLRQTIRALNDGTPWLAPLPPPPQKMFRPLGNGQGVVDPPKVVYVSRIALALRNVVSQAWDRAVGRRSTMLTAGFTGAFDGLDVPRAMKTIELGEGLPPDFYLSPEETQQQVAAREQAAAQQQQLENLEKAASAAGKAKGTKLEQNLGQ